jgi:hypothetical protein
MFWIEIFGRIFGAKREKITGGRRKSNHKTLQFVDQIMIE